MTEVWNTRKSYIICELWSEELKSTAPVSQRSKVRIPYKPEFFSGFLFATAKVAYITAMIIVHLKLWHNHGGNILKDVL